MARVRSPNYPQLNLGEAIARVKVVYDKNHVRPESREVVAKALGYTSLNGTSMGVISALTKYGLLELVGENIRVSRDARDILLHHKGEPERAAAVGRAAFLPALFQELHEEYGDRIPGEHSLEVYLAKKNFNPNTVPSVMRVYRDTMEFVKEESIDSDEGFEDDQEAEVPMQAQAMRGNTSDAGTPTAPTVSAPVLDSNWTDQLQLRLSDNVTAFVAFRGAPTSESVGKLIRLLAVQYDLDVPKTAAPPPQGASNQPTQWRSADDLRSVDDLPSAAELSSTNRDSTPE